MDWPWQPVQWPQVLRKAQPSDGRDGRLESWEVIHQERWSSEANIKGFRFSRLVAFNSFNMFQPSKMMNNWDVATKLGID